MPQINHYVWLFEKSNIKAIATPPIPLGGCPCSSELASIECKSVMYAPSVDRSSSLLFCFVGALTLLLPKHIAASLTLTRLHYSPRDSYQHRLLAAKRSEWAGKHFAVAVALNACILLGSLLGLWWSDVKALVELLPFFLWWGSLSRPSGIVLFMSESYVNIHGYSRAIIIVH